MAELLAILRAEDKPSENKEESPRELAEEDKEPEALGKSEESQEESEGKNIFKYNRDSSDEEESDDEGRNHKRRKSSGQESPEKESKLD